MAFFGAAYIWVFGAPFFATVIFTVLCLIWSAWILVSIFKGTDELKTAGIRYALAVASGVGVPLSIAFVMLMVAYQVFSRRSQALQRLQEADYRSPRLASHWG